MAGTVVPMVRGNPRGKRKPFLLAIYSAASAFGGITVGVALRYPVDLIWHRTSMPPNWRVVVIGLCALIFAARDAELAKIPAPHSSWRVPRSWAGMRSKGLAVALYGFFMGGGVATTMSSCLYPVLLWVLLGGTVWQSALVLMAFGISRTIPMWFLYTRFVKEPNSYQARWIWGLNVWRPVILWSNALILAIVGGVFMS